MKRYLSILILLLLCTVSCKQKAKQDANLNTTANTIVSQENELFTMVFASCNDQDREQPLWAPIMAHKPDVFIWGGDNIYADTEDMQKMQADYDKLKSQPDYTKLRETTTVIGTWDDHDYGINDGGKEWAQKAAAQNLFLDFLDIPKSDSLRTQVGVYHKQVFKTEQGSVQILLLDTRSFRDGLLPSKTEGRRYDPWPEDHTGTVLGANQWAWLERELEDESHDFTIIVTSIQFLSGDHGWEKWDHFPNEVNKMYKVLTNAKAKNIFMLSGDRHHAEIQVNKDAGLTYPLVELTSSGLTHTFPGDPLEPNPYRVGEGTKELNFSVLQLDFKKKQVLFEIRGKDDYLFEMMLRQY